MELNDRAPSMGPMMCDNCAKEMPKGPAIRISQIQFDLGQHPMGVMMNFCSSDCSMEWAKS